MYITKIHKSIMIGKKHIGMAKNYTKLYFKQRDVNKQFGLKLPNDMMKLGRHFQEENRLNLCATFKELQPRSSQLIHKFKFVVYFLN